MHLKPNADFMKFLSAVNHCEADVLLCTEDGDVLNLKSKLCQYIFVSLTIRQDILAGAIISTKSTDDLLLLRDFLDE